MSWFLIFLGAFLGGVVTLLLAIVIGWFLLKRWVAKKLAGLSEGFDSIMAQTETVPPFRLHLQPGAGTGWDEDSVQLLLEPLKARGFVDAGLFHSSGVGQFSFTVRGLAAPSLGTWAAAYFHPAVGNWVDLYTQFSDDTTLTYATNSDPGMDHPEYVTVVHMPGVATDALLDAFLAAKNRPTKPVDPSQFREVFTQAYARNMDWRIERGGVTVSEVERQMAKMELAEDTDRATMVESIQQAWKAKINQYYDEQFAEKLVRAVKVDPKVWAEMKDRVLFIHDRLSAPELFERCERVFGLDDDEHLDEAGDQLRDQVTELTQQHSPGEAFPRIAALFSDQCVVKKLGVFSRPVPSTAYEIRWNAS